MNWYKKNKFGALKFIIKNISNYVIGILRGDSSAAFNDFSSIFHEDNYIQSYVLGNAFKLVQKSEVGRNFSMNDFMNMLNGQNPGQKENLQSEMPVEQEVPQEVTVEEKQGQLPLED